jgi:inner membrane protein
VDPLSQAALGAAVALGASPRKSVARRAALLGALSGMAADLDVFMRSSSDPLFFLEYHRQFTHALVFIPVGAAICALVLFPLVRGRMSFREGFVYCLLGYATHGLLDACTTYGTQLFWPFSDVRIAWNNVSVVDPLFTLPMLAFLVAASFRNKPLLARFACAWAVLYLMVGVLQRERAQAFGLDVAVARGHAPVWVDAKPSFGNLYLWKTIYEQGDRYYVDATRMGWTPKSFPGQNVRKLDLARDLEWVEPGSQQARDIERFRWFSAGYVSLDPARADRVIDVRYSIVPNRIEPLWGIALEREAPPERHVKFFTSRGVTRERRAEVTSMLFD